MTEAATMPRHVAIIMDGNGRWAKKRKLPRVMGHNAGMNAMKEIVRRSSDLGVEYLTVYAFSTENWKRDADEIAGIMNLFRKYLIDAEDFKKDNIRIHFIGERDRLADDLVVRMKEIEEESAERTGLILNIAINYGGRDEIVHAAKELGRKVRAGEISPDDIDEDMFGSMMFTSDSPELDLILRPSGEQRISNFLLWQCAYAEFVYMDTLWPDFTPADLDRAIEEFNHRSRRFGGR